MRDAKKILSPLSPLHALLPLKSIQKQGVTAPHDVTPLSPLFMKAEKPKTNAQYAARYGVETRTIMRWKKRGYPLDDPAKVAELEAGQKNSRRARAEAEAVQVDAAKLSDDQLKNPPDLAHAKLYHLILSCRRLAHANATEQGQYIAKDEAREQVTRIAMAMRSRLLSVPGEMAGRLVGKVEHEIQQTLHAEMVAVLTELSNPHNPAHARA